MKITIFTSDVLNGGVAQVTKSYIHLFQDIEEIEKVDIIVLRGKKAELEKNGKIDKVIFINENTKPSFSIKVFQVLKASLWFVLYISRNKTDIVISLNLEPNLIVNLSKFLLNIKIKNITTEHTNLINYYSKTNLFKEIFKSILELIYPKSSAIVGCSDGVRQSIETIYGVTNTTFIYNPIRSDLFYDVSEKKDFYLTLGRIDPLKGYKELICSIGEHLVLKKRKLKIAGDGPDSDKLKQLVEDLKLKDYVEFVGYVANPSSLYSEARAYITTSYLEGFPLNLIEAQSYKLPIIASDCLSGPREIILGQTDYENRLKTGHIERNGCFLIPTPESTTFRKDLNDVLNLLDSQEQKSYEVSDVFGYDKIKNKWRELFVLVK